MKWRFEDAKQHFEREGLAKTFEELFDEICVIVAKTFVAADERMCEPINRAQKTRNLSFELFGFDILVDAQLKPWILEVGMTDQCNVGPSMNQDADLDMAVKVPLVTDMINMIGLKPYKRLSAKTRLTKTGQKMLADYGKSRAKLTTVKEAGSLTEENFRSVLKAEDYLILLEAEEEFSRRGNFRRVFPTIPNVNLLQPCLEVERANNILLWRHLELKEQGVDMLRAVVRPHG